MHGLIFLYLQQFARKKSGEPAWQDWLRGAGLSRISFSPVLDYPDSVAVALIESAGTALGQPTQTVLEQFGEFLAPEFLRLYSSLIHPEWKTIEVIANTEELIHATVRMRNPGARPPMLQCLRTGDDEIRVVYSSPLRMCGLARGIVRGMARHFAETVEVQDEACMLRGDPFCSLLVQRTPAKAETARAPVAETHSGRVELTWSGHNDGAIDYGELAGDPGAGTASYPFLAPPSGPDELGRLGPYRVIRPLGSGGMGIVFQAEDTRLLRPVALKVLQPVVAADQSVRERFLREARTLAALRCAHVVTVYEGGTANGVTFLAMELLHGESLDSLRDRKGVPPVPDLLRIAREAAEGLAEAHAKGFIHRDVKPSNLWVETSGRVKLLDFGLAQAAGGTRLTRQGEALGTPAFMAPEQARGEPVDPRADLFSLGAVLYWLATGHSPFQGNDPYSTLLAVMTREPAPPHELNLSLPPELSELVMRMLEKDPDRRPRTSREVV
ncbi:MAG TPA: protein kinase, partial [Fimbriiglobus sp.]|nr:protein kinase [Fimbriiglobus sp.]